MKQIVLDAKNVHAALEYRACRSLLIVRKPKNSKAPASMIVQCQVCSASVSSGEALREILASLEKASQNNIKFVFDVEEEG